MLTGMRVILVILLVIFLVLEILSLAVRKKSRYKGNIEECNKAEGKKEIFVEDMSYPENADGKCGYRKPSGELEYEPTLYERYIKRALDIFISFFGLIALSPIFIIISLLIVIEDPGPIFFTQKRIGRNKEYFRLHKFRSMRVDTPKDVPTHMFDDPEKYITKVGKFIREHSLDELPQIWDIFIGNMSIVGPRPALWNQEWLISERDKYDANCIRPGLTGPAQLNGRDILDITDKARYDGEYTKMLKKSTTMGILSDIGIFLKTIKMVFIPDGVVEGSSGDEVKSILVVCQYYYPEPFRITDICEEMAARGYEVHVVTGYPNYPEGKLYEGYGRGKRIEEVINGVYVHRCYTIPRGNGSIKRFLNYYSFMFSSKRFVKSSICHTKAGKSFDLVFCNQLSPVMMANAGIEYAKRHRVKRIMYCLDLWPESLLAGGVKKDSFIFRHYHFVSDEIYNSMDTILVTSRMFKSYLVNEFCIDEKKIWYLPQYAEDIFTVLPKKEKSNIYTFMFAGNIGELQSIDTIVKAAKLLKDEPIKIYIVGSGKHLETLVKMAASMDNIIFTGRMDLEKMPEMYSKADAMLVTMKKDDVLSLTLPGKVQSYLAAGKPIIGAIDGETKEVINAASCGFAGDAENEVVLAENMKRFIASKEKEKMGKNARAYYETHFEKKSFMDTLEKSFIKK